jgi:phosphate transport system ATP-binding protein
MSIYDNVAYGPRIHGRVAELDALVERSLTRAGLWEEVHGDLQRSATALSGGQMQRLVIARCLALDPEVILMDEPTASLDPLASGTIEDLIHELAADYTVVLVTHDLQQAVRLADRTAFVTPEFLPDGTRVGRLVEYGPTADLFEHPQDPRTRDYVDRA